MRTLVFLIAVAIAVASAEGAPGDPLAGYSVMTWTEFDDALHSRGVYAITQDHEGYIWLGFLEGLRRFDGTRFVSWQSLGRPPLAGSTVTGLATARDGTFWIGFGNLGGVSRYTNGTLQHFTTADGVPDSAVRQLFEDRGGTMWVTTFEGVARFRGNRWERVEAAHGLPAGALHFISEDDAGTLWISSTAGVFRLNAASDRFESASRQTTPAAPFGSDIAQSLSSDWIKQIFLPPGVAARPVMLRDRRRQLWAGTQTGLVLVARHSGHDMAPAALSSQPSLNGQVIEALLEDREGNVWAGSTAGLTMLRVKADAVTHYAQPEFHAVRALARTIDAVWAGASKGLARIGQNGIEWFTERNGLPGRISALHADAGGTLWLATDKGLATFARGRFSTVPTPVDARIANVVSLTTDPEGGIWLGESDGMYRLKGGAVSDLSATPLAGQRPNVAYTDSRGRVWIGLRSGAVVRYDRGSYRLYTQADGLAAGRVSAIYEDREHALWVGTLNGFSRLDGDRFVSLGATNVLSHVMTTSLTADDEGYIWVGTFYGLVRMKRQEFDRAVRDPGYRPPYRILNASDGLDDALSVRAFQRAVSGPDGTLWFSNPLGLIAVEPRRIADIPAPPARVEQVSTDERTFPPAGSVRLTARTSRVQIDYTTLAFASPARVQFRYLLEGFDRDWVDAGLARRAVYTNLPPRSYRFRVAASHDGSQWNEAQGALELTVEPAFYQTTSFYAAVILTIGLLVWATWQARLRSVRHKYALVLAERARLGREIHDTLLQGMVGVALQVHTISEALDPSLSPLKTRLGRARDTLEEYIRETRHTIWDLRSAALDRRNLPEALRRAAAMITAGTPTHIDVVVRGKVAPCDPRVEEHLLRIAHEAMTNAVRHGRAGRIQVELAYESDALRLSVHDDGCGFDAAEAEYRAGDRWGLRTMRERAQQIGAQFRCQSTPHGTVIEAVAPLTAIRV